ncbi:imm11 family protein [Flavipsychrobacter stenotrophus]|nr:DUF1629 domain-containing protein [Flavipsychrobacter stenotrophus]
MNAGYNYVSEFSVSKLSRCYDRLPAFIPDLDSFILSSKALLTDILSTSLINRGLIVSNRVKEILEKCLLPEHAFFPIGLYYKNERIENYFWFHLISDFVDNIDFEKSTFYLKDYNIDEAITINSEVELRKIMKTKSITANIKSDNVVLKNKINFDLFKIGTFDINIYISDKLKNVFNEQQITGIQILPSQLY